MRGGFRTYSIVPAYGALRWLRLDVYSGDSGWDSDFHRGDGWFAATLRELRMRGTAEAMPFPVDITFRQKLAELFAR